MYHHGIFFVAQQSTIKLYRAMKVSSAEGNYLRSCHNGATVSINSFVSTSRNLEVAKMYLGDDLQTTVMLEILIDLTMLNSNSPPFGDISALSHFPNEEEVLMSMGTILKIQSKTIDSEKKILYIQAQLCHEESAELKELKTLYFKTIA